jgi:Protein of unknown function (DUF5661)
MGRIMRMKAGRSSSARRTGSSFSRNLENTGSSSLRTCSRRRPARGDLRAEADHPAAIGAIATVDSMTARRQFTADEARAAGERIGIDWNTSRFDIEQFRMGMDVELEHGTHDLGTNVTGDDADITAKIARAHLNEFPDYYSRLAVMEADAEAYWEARGR